MIVIAGGIKGGSGKTTVATNLAVIRASQGYDVLLVDADDQETATDFTNLRKERYENIATYTGIKLSGAAVRTEIMRLSQKYQDIVIDTGGRDTTSQRAAMSIADVLIVPFIPRSFDIWTLEKVSSIVEEMRSINSNLKAYTFINRADPRGQDNTEAGQALQNCEALKFIDAPLGSRKSYSNAAAIGLAVTELKPQDIKSVEEMMVLYRYVFDIKIIS